MADKPENTEQDKYGTTLGTGADYTGWTWRQIMAAIVGGADMGGTKQNKLTGEFSSPESLTTAGNIFWDLAVIVNNALSTFNYNVNALVGEGGPWQGDAASVARDNFTFFSRSVEKQLDALTGRGDPEKAVYNQLYDSGNTLGWAIDQIHTIDQYYAGEAARLGAGSHTEPDGTTLIHVSDIEGLPEMIADSMRPVLQTLSDTYAIKNGHTQFPAYNPPMLPPKQPEQPDIPEIKIPDPPKIDAPDTDIPNQGDIPNAPDVGGPGAPALAGGPGAGGLGGIDPLDPNALGGPGAAGLVDGPGIGGADGIDPLDPNALGGPGGANLLGGPGGPGLPSGVRPIDPFNSNTKPSDIGGLTAPTPSAFGPIPGLNSDIGLGPGDIRRPGGIGSLGPIVPFTGGAGGGGPLKNFHLSAPGQLRSTGLTNPKLSGPSGFDEFGNPIGGKGGKGLGGFDAFGRPIGKGPNGLDEFDEFGRPIGKGGKGLGALGRGSAAALEAEEAALARRAGAGGAGGMPYPPGGMGGAPGRQGDQERERTTWLEEDEEVWGADPDVGPSVLGRA
jgi:hypothetical protein